MKDIYLDIDLDYFNRHPLTLSSLTKLLNKLNPKTKCKLIIEHQRALGHIKNAVKKSWIKTPFQFVHVDEHHDYYRMAYKHHLRILDCGNFMAHIPKEYYDEIIWYSNAKPVTDDWEFAKRYLQENSIEPKHIINTEPHTFRIKWDNVKFITFCLSPDYCDGNLRPLLPEMINLVENYFKLRTTIVKNSNGIREWSVRGWIPVKKLINGKIISLKKEDNIATGSKA